MRPIVESNKFTFSVTCHVGKQMQEELIVYFILALVGCRSISSDRMMMMMMMMMMTTTTTTTTMMMMMMMIVMQLDSAGVG